MTRPRRPRNERRLAVALALLAVACAGPRTGDAPAAAPHDAPAASSAAPSGAAAHAPRYLCAADYSARHAGRALFVVENGETVFATGQNGHAPDAVQPLGAASQAFWGVAAVAAETDGLLALDEPAAATLPEFAADPAKREVRLRQLLQQTSGLSPGVAALRRDATPDLTARALSLELIAPPGTAFQHGPSHVAVFYEVLRRKLEPRGERPEDYLERRVLAPLGIALEPWARDASGNVDAAYGASARPGQWAGLGRLLLAGGGEVLPEEAVASLLAGSRPAPEFALGFWLNPADPGSVHAFYPDGLRDLVVAAGEGNQRLYVIPSLDLVVVRTGDPDRGWRDREFLACLVPGGAAAADAPEEEFPGSG